MGGEARADTDTQTRTFAWPAVRAVRIDGTIAQVRVLGSARKDISVEITREAPTRADLERLPIAWDEAEGTLAVTALQADDGKDPRIHARIVVSVPAEVPIESLHVFEGLVALEGLGGGVSVTIERGDVTARGLGGAVRLETLIGNITVTDLVPERITKLHCRLFNGSATVALDAPPRDARILLLTLNGKVVTNLPVNERSSFGPRFAEATLGRGEPVYSVDVVRGDITFRAAGVRPPR